MKIRNFDISFRSLMTLSALLLLVASVQADKPTLRETPLVRAVKRARASVVNIHSEKTNYNSDSVFSTGKGRKVNGMGTGIIIDARGYIVTNHHVVNGVDSLRLTLDDGSTFAARVVSFDRKHDLAIIKVKSSTPLQVMRLGTSSDLMLAESVFAVGNAYGYEHTVTSGIISSLSRDVDVNEKQSYKNLIQTDASINPGNSGGPLLNLNGDVIGINVAIRAGAQRIGFAIPIDDARIVIAKLLNIEKLDNHWHGLKSKDHKQGKVRELIVRSTSSKSPAAKAGFERGDIILKAGNIQVADRADFERALLGKTMKEKIEVVVRRNGKKENLNMTLAMLGGQRFANAKSKHQIRTTVRRSASESTDKKAWRVLGLKLNTILVKTGRISGTQYRGGMRVLQVRPRSPAARSGIRTGDILVGLHVWETINKENVSYVLDHSKLKTILPLKFYVIRGSETLFGDLKIASR